MINHVRTLLLNVDGSNNPGPTFFGEEYVPPEFKAVDYPSFIVDIREKLFGAEPDRAMLNYRLWQFMQVLHSTDDLSQHVEDFDPRVTYVDSKRIDLYNPVSFEPVVDQISGVTAELFPQQGPAVPDQNGRVRHQYEVDILSSSTVRVKQETQPIRQEIVSYTFADGLSSRINLLDSGWGVLLGTDSAGTSWKVEVRNRPQYDLGQLVASVAAVGEPVFLELFGLAPEEPMLTFKNLWETNKETPYRLGGLLLALARRSDEARRQVVG